MSLSENRLKSEVMAVGSLPIIDPILQVICKTTGMGFAAVAKVTSDRWIACGVRDEINFGLQMGGELEVQTTICNQIRENGVGVVIDQVDQDPFFRCHPTPILYGFKSYISVPIILQNGDFFGTLCAIDPEPAKLNNPEIISLFNLFAELLSFHISSLRKISALQDEQKKSGIQIYNYEHEIAQYRHLTNHILQEPLRKISIFSGLLVNSSLYQQKERMMETAQKINRLASDLSTIVQDIADFTILDLDATVYTEVALAEIFNNARRIFQSALEERGAILDIDLPFTIPAIPDLLQQSFAILLKGSISRHHGCTPLLIGIRSSQLPQEEVWKHKLLHPDKRYCEIIYRDNNPVLGDCDAEKRFDITHNTNSAISCLGLDTQLAQVRKIVSIHGGAISGNDEMSISIILPLHHH